MAMATHSPTLTVAVLTTHGITKAPIACHDVFACTRCCCFSSVCPPWVFVGFWVSSCLGDDDVVVVAWMGLCWVLRLAELHTLSLPTMAEERE